MSLFLVNGDNTKRSHIMSQSTPLYPLLLERHLSPRIWGGTKLSTYLALPDEPRSEPIGESWQVYAQNRIRNGPLAGQTLAQAAQAYGEALLGTRSVSRYGSTVPLLAKFIDARDRLSIQVHPDDAYALEHERESGYLGKTEAWYILEVDPGAVIIWGFKDDLSQEQIREKIDRGTLEPHLNVVPVSAGDVIYNPAGTLHAVGAGIFLFEIQQSSDLTYRLYDYDRRDASGNKRELHVDKALAVLERTPREEAKVTPRALSEGKTTLVAVPNFVMERWEVRGMQQERVDAGSHEILTVTEGGVELSAAGSVLPLTQGESVVLPASLDGYALSGEATVLRCYLPGDAG
jgi:mannose-6-phosphate isomerase